MQSPTGDLTVGLQWLSLPLSCFPACLVSEGTVILWASTGSTF